MAYFEQVNGVAADYLLGGGGVTGINSKCKSSGGRIINVAKFLKTTLVHSKKSQVVSLQVL